MQSAPGTPGGMIEDPHACLEHRGEHALQTFLEQQMADTRAKVKSAEKQQSDAHKLLRHQLDEKLQALSRIFMVRVDDVARTSCERYR